MAEKPASEDFSQAFTGIINSAALNSIYEGVIDATFNTFARNITLYLTPAKSLPTANAENYNPYWGVGGQDPRLDESSDNTGNKGVVITPITVVYKGHIKHGPATLSEHNSFLLNENQVAVTLIYSALDDVNECIEADIDGQKWLLDKGSRPIGFSDKKYLITFWTRKINPGSA